MTGRNPRTARIAGRTAESDVVAWLRGQGAVHAERRKAGERLDRGDVAGLPGVVIEVKNPGAGRPIELGSWLTETMRETANDNASVGLLVVRRRLQLSPANWYWITDGNTIAPLLRAAGWLPDPPPTEEAT